MLNKRYNYILFDLDRTIWDFDKNAYTNLTSLLSDFGLNSINKESFINRYQTINKLMWEKYEKGEIEKEVLKYERFHTILLEYGVDNRNMAIEMGDQYLARMPHQTALMPYAYETLTTLKKRGKKMAIVTNGLLEVQYKKIENSKLEHFFEAVMVSEEQGVHKPSPTIFKRALNAINGVKEESLMVGDDFINDIEGAMIFGIDQFFYNYHNLKCEGRPTYNSSDLRDLLKE